MIMTKVKQNWLSLTDERFVGDRLSDTPLLKLTGEPNINYRNQNGELFRYSAAELIAAGYETVPWGLTIDAVYILRSVKKPAAL